MATVKNAFEYQIDNLIKVFNSWGKGLAWKNHPNRLHDGTYVKGQGEPFDYIFITKHKTFCFDAKQTEQEKWHLQPKDIKQAKNLLVLENIGIDSFFLVYFFQRKAYRKIRPSKIIKKTISFEEMEEFKFDKEVRKCLDLEEDS